MPQKPSVLVVDDDYDSRELLGEYLSFRGFTVTTAADGADAVARAEEMRPHVVLMDLALPGIMDGWEATRRVKSHPLLKHIVVIAVTAHGFPAEHQKAMRAGCHAVITKPYNLDELAARIEQIVAERCSVES